MMYKSFEQLLFAIASLMNQNNLYLKVVEIESISIFISAWSYFLSTKWHESIFFFMIENEFFIIDSSMADDYFYDNMKEIHFR